MFPLMSSRLAGWTYAGPVNAVALCERIDAVAHTDTVFLDCVVGSRLHRPAAGLETFETMAEEMGV